MDIQKIARETDECEHEQNGFPCFLPAQRVLNLISKKWSIQLIYLLRKGKKIRYNDLKQELQRGCRSVCGASADVGQLRPPHAVDLRARLGKRQGHRQEARRQLVSFQAARRTVCTGALHQHCDQALASGCVNH